MLLLIFFSTNANFVIRAEEENALGIFSQRIWIQSELSFISIDIVAADFYHPDQNRIHA